MADIKVISGPGGNGCMSFRREKYVPRGGPNGGSGGNGGHVIIRATSQLNTLIAFRYEKKFQAHKGQHGLGKNKHGKKGEDAILEVPIGTVVKEKRGQDYVVVADLSANGQEIIVARGGKGGMGNALLATSTYQAPHFAQLGERGEEKELQLELKLLADVGLIGLPNAGKSTLISVISNARPKIADYPFTTLVPNLGMVRYRQHDFVVADIPGLIAGAHEGKGLGHEFLRHVERTRILIHLLDGSKLDPRVLTTDYITVNEELRLFDERILAKPQIVVLTKIDVLTPEQIQAVITYQPLLKSIARYSQFDLLPVSSAAHTRLEQLLDTIADLLDSLPPKNEVLEQPAAKIFRPLEENEKYFRIEHKAGRFIVRGPRAEKIAQTIDLNNDEAVRWMHDRLKWMGVYAELEKKGIQSGDQVVIGTVAFTWE